MFKKLKNYIKKINDKEKSDENTLLLLGQIYSKLNESLNYKDINDKEFKIFSQWGEDGIIDYLVSNISIENKTFIEFGVEDYKEANTKFLLLNKNWQGLIIDSSIKNIKSIKQENIYWKYDLTAINAFITKDNINKLIEEKKFERKVGLLSIDIDGNDYWIWEAINTIDPSIVIVEYNSRLGNEKKFVVPYNKNFDRKKQHFSMIYYGASLQALAQLGTKKGYTFVCCNKAGNNAFFIKKELVNDRVKLNDLSKGFYKNKFRESRDENGNLTYLSNKEENNLLFNLPLEEV